LSVFGADSIYGSVKQLLLILIALLCSLNRACP